MKMIKKEDVLLKTHLKKINMKMIIKILAWIIGVVLSFYILIGVILHIPDLIPSAFTIYSQDFNKTHFEKIEIGMDREYVETQIGKPLRESENNYYQDSITDISWYTRKKVYGLSYERIFIVFYEDTVVDKIRVVDID